jgi:hypothetical protein
MTSNGVLVLAAGLGMGLLLGGLTASWVRGELKTQATREMLTKLDEALSAYHKAVGHWPADRPPDVQKNVAHARRYALQTGERTSASALQQAADWVVAALVSVPEAKAAIDQIPRIYRVVPELTEMTPLPGAGFSLVDGWRHHLGCLTAESPTERDRRAVAANGGRPLFISPGPDGVFGSQSIASATDDLFIQPSPRQSTRPGP